MEQYTVYLTAVCDGVHQSGIRCIVNATDAHSARIAAKAYVREVYGTDTVTADDAYHDGPATMDISGVREGLYPLYTRDRTDRV